MNSLISNLTHHRVETGHSPTLAINQDSAQLAAAHQTVYRFGFGQSPFPVPPHVVAALRDATARKEYVEVQGLRSLRDNVAAFHSVLGETPWHPERVVVGTGSKILLFALLAALKEADVLLVSPCWVSYAPQARLLGHSVHYLRTQAEDKWRLTPETLQKYCESRQKRDRPLVLILNYPGNPSGTTYPPDTLAMLAPILREHRVCVISDEIYGLLNHRGDHTSISKFYPEGTIVTTGLSKWCGAGGWRLGVAHIPPALGEPYFQSVIGVCSETFSCASTPIQYAATTAYADTALTETYLHRQRSILAEVGNECATRLRKANIPTAEPEGGFYLFPDFSEHREKLAARGITSSAELSRRLLHEAGVALLPGSDFGMPNQALNMRLAYVDFNGADSLQTGKPDIGHLLAGVEAIATWLDAQ